MMIEQDICRCVCNRIAEILPRVAVEGNWLPSFSDEVKGEPVRDGASVKVSVAPRFYDRFSSRVASFAVVVSATLRSDVDMHGGETFACCSRLISLFDGWQGDIEAVKRDFAPVKKISPVGLLLMDGSVFEIDNETLVRNYSQKFLIKARVCK